MVELIDEIMQDPDSVLNDETKLKEVVQDPELAVKLLESKGVEYLDVTVENQNIAIVQSVDRYDDKNEAVNDGGMIKNE